MIGNSRRHIPPDHLLMSAVRPVYFPFKMAAEMVEPVILVVGDGSAGSNNIQLFFPDLPGYPNRNLLIGDGADDYIVGLFNLKIQHIQVENPDFGSAEPGMNIVVESFIDFNDVKAVGRPHRLTDNFRNRSGTGAKFQNS